MARFHLYLASLLPNHNQQADWSEHLVHWLNLLCAGLRLTVYSKLTIQMQRLSQLVDETTSFSTISDYEDFGLLVLWFINPQLIVIHFKTLIIATST